MHKFLYTILLIGISLFSFGQNSGINYQAVILDPNPIAMPGKAALMAAVQPANTPALYFVAKGDGTSYFSATLEEHNAAVNRYQRKAAGQ